MYPADHPGIQYSHPSLGEHKNVPGVRVSVIETVAKDHLHEHSGALVSQRFAVYVPVV